MGKVSNKVKEQKHFTATVPKSTIIMIMVRVKVEILMIIERPIIRVTVTVTLTVLAKVTETGRGITVIEVISSILRI
jgi:hypothetical protein